MKKIILTLAVAFSSMGVVLAGSVPGNPAGAEEKINEKVLNAFNREFKSAKEITWIVASNYLQAIFVYNDQHISAYYNTEGELLGLSRFISPADLPLALQGDLKKNHSDYWVIDLFEVANDNGTSYYLTLEDSDSKVVLKASDGKTWQTYKKVRKA